MTEATEHVYDFHKIKAPYLQLVIIVLGVFMAILDTSVVNVAIPTMETELRATTAQIQWVLTAYMLVIGVLVPISGWLTDRFGAKRLFLLSLAVFTIGSALCGASWNLSSIIVFRIIQALGGALMQPVAMSIIFRLFPPNKRGGVMGILGIAMMAAPAFGPVLSGYFVQYWTWRLIFYINVPIGVTAIILGVVAMHEFPHQSEGKFDMWGFMFTVVGFFSLLYGFNEVSSYGWRSPMVESYIWIGVVCLIALVIIELNVKHPMIQFAVFKNYMFSMSLVLLSLISIAMFVGIFFLPIYLQDARGFDALHTGLFMAPAAIASAIAMPISGRLFDRIGARPLGLVGLLIVIYASIGFAELGMGTNTSHIQWLYILRNAGMGIIMMPLMTAGMNTVPVHLTNQGSAMSNTARQVAASFGTAILTTYMTTQSKVHAVQLSWQVTPMSQYGQFLSHIEQALRSTGMPPEVAKSAAASMVSGLLQLHSLVFGMDRAFMVSAIITGVAFVCMVFFASKKEHALRTDARTKAKKSPAADASQGPMQGHPALAD